MKERPILMSAPMVRSILDGSKTQTRRVSGLDVINAEPNRYEYMGIVSGPGTSHAAFHDKRTGAHVLVRVPYGQPGDRLWVKENYRLLDSFDNDSATRVAEMCAEAGYRKPWAPVHYEADGARENWQHVGTPPHDGRPKAGKLRPNIFLPRWLSRITLEVIGVRVERLNDCSEADAIAEGIEGSEVVINGRNQGKTWRDYDLKCDDPCEWFGSSVRSYRSLWEQINGAGSWKANPWVWAVEFKCLFIDTAKQG